MYICVENRKTLVVIPVPNYLFSTEKVYWRRNQGTVFYGAVPVRGGIFFMAYNKNRLRDLSIKILDDISRILIFYDMDVHYAKKWEKIKLNIARRNKKRSIKRFLFLKLTYDLYDGKPPTVEQCDKRYKILLEPYASVLNSEYWSVDVINELLKFLNRKKAYTISEAIALYKEKFA